MNTGDTNLGSVPLNRQRAALGYTGSAINGQQPQ